MNLAEQIAQWKASLQAAQAKRDALLTLAVTENRTNTAEELTEDAALEAEIAAAGTHITRLETFQARAALAAQPVQPTVIAASDPTATAPAPQAPQAASNARPPMHLARNAGPAVIIRDNAPDQFLGQTFTRVAIAKMVAKMDGVPAQVVAQQRWGRTNPIIAKLLDPQYQAAKASGRFSFMAANEVAGGGAQSGSWGAELVTPDNRFSGDFIEFLYSKTVYDKLPLRSVPAHVNIKGQDGASTGYWVGEGKAIPVTNADFVNVTLTPFKVAALTAISKELLRDSTPAAEALVRDSLAEASSQVIDTTFIGSAAGTSNVKPAGLFYNVAGLGSNGTDAGAVRKDVQELVGAFITAKNSSGLHWIMHPSLAMTLSLMRNALGNAEFPGIGPEGGTFFGFPVTTGDNVPATALILIKPSDIYKIGDSGLNVDTSTDATIEMNSAPTGDLLTPTAASQAMVNMFQADSVAIKVVRSTNYAKRRTSAAVWMETTAYDVASTT